MRISWRPRIEKAVCLSAKHGGRDLVEGMRNILYFRLAERMVLQDFHFGILRRLSEKRHLASQDLINVDVTSRRGRVPCSIKLRDLCIIMQLKVGKKRPRQPGTT
jgi:hypothetical protein